MNIKPLFITLVLVLMGAAVAAPIYFFTDNEEPIKKLASSGADPDEDPDMPAGLKIDKGEYIRLRSEQLMYLRGLDTAKRDSRSSAIREMEAQISARANDALLAQQGVAFERSWRPLGPAPIPINTGVSYSGRTTAIAVDPVDANIVYVGTAQGGLYRSLNGGTTWTPLLDNALSLAIGAIAIAPSDRNTVFVGTGEPEFSGDSFFGVGIYRITNATADPVISGPLNRTSGGNDIFSGRSISEIIVHPTDPNIIFASSASGTAGIGSSAGFPFPNAGIFRSTNAMSADPTFSQLTIQGTGNVNRSVIDLATEPGNPNKLIAGVVGGSGDGGVYVSNDALAATPTFLRTLITGDGTSTGRVEFAVNKNAGTGVVTVYAASGLANGTLYRSIDGGATWPTSFNNQFCNPQCFYDIAIDVDRSDANRVFLGGSPNRVFQRSLDGGATFTTNAQTAGNLHVDTQAIAISPSDPNTVYFGSDGGIWRTSNASATPIVWTSLNNSGYHATQFQGIALHPILRNYSLGGTQDNGTQYLVPERSWIQTDVGDGGFAAVDSNATTQNDVIAYHTYFNRTGTQIGFTRALTSAANGDQFWTGFRGCGGSTNPGFVCTDEVLFYAPLVTGPNTTGSLGNTIYFGTSRLYRSADRGTTVTDVSGVLSGTGTRISAIAISPQTDDVRLVGTTAGTVFLSLTPGANTMNNVTGPWPARYIGRAAIDPSNANVAYVCLNGFGVPADMHVWKTNNLLSGTPTWSPAGHGIPDVPVNAFVVDPANTQSLYAGTDIGVYESKDGGTTWTPFSNGLPRVAVFGMELQAKHRVLRIATHGKGMWEYDLGNKQPIADFDGDGRTDLSIFRPSDGTWWFQKSFDLGVGVAQFGNSADIPAAADFTGDGRIDITFFRPSTGEWFILRSNDFAFFSFPFGANGDIPMPGDYDGDGKADAAVFRPSNGLWFILRSSDAQTAIGQWGRNGDQPVAADYDGDGMTDVAIFRPDGTVGAEWWVQLSSGGVNVFQFGNSTDKAVPGDYTGDGRADEAFWRPSTGEWFILRSEDFNYFSFPFGQNGDVPVPGDYDGDASMDAAVFRPVGSAWFMNRTTSGVAIGAFGLPTDRPVPNQFVR
jgi:photosystem II stability/assembly factor-like uncharacterized protein